MVGRCWCLWGRQIIKTSAPRYAPFGAGRVSAIRQWPLVTQLVIQSRQRPLVTQLHAAWASPCNNCPPPPTSPSNPPPPPLAPRGNTAPHRAPLPPMHTYAVNAVLHIINSCSQTGAGKTYTMYGDLKVTQGLRLLSEGKVTQGLRLLKRAAPLFRRAALCLGAAPLFRSSPSVQESIPSLNVCGQILFCMSRA